MSARTKAIQKAVGRKATKKQQSLIAQLEAGEIPAKALEAAGYKSSNMAQTMSSPIVRKALTSIEQNTQELTSLTREDVVEGLLSAILMAENLEDPATMIRGWNEISRLHGFHAAEKRQIEHKGEISHEHSGELNVEQIPTTKLLELSAKENAIEISPNDYKELPDEEDPERRAQSEASEEEDPSSGVEDPSSEVEDVEYFDPTDEEGVDG